MKRRIAILLALVLAFGLVACGPANNANPTTEPKPAVTPTTDPNPTVETEPAVEPTTAPTVPPEQVSQFRVIDYNDPNWFVNAHLQDLDGDWPLFYLDDLSSREAMIGRADWYFNQLFNGTQVTDVLLCAFEQSSFVQADTMDWVFEKEAKAMENGTLENMDYFKGVAEKGQPLYYALTEYGVDWYQLAIDHCNEAGVRPWIYFRMNDHHGVDWGDVSLFHDSFWYEAKENGWLIGNEETYGFNIANTYDFAHEEVRQWMLAYIEEIACKYDAFGLQLDFMREIFCFDYLNNPDKTEIMTQFIRDVAAIVKEAEAIHGHDMKLMIRLGVDLDHNLVYGYDVAQWAKEGLMDAVVPSPRWNATNSGIPIAKWVEAVGDDIAIFPGFEYCLMDPIKIKQVHVKGIAAGYMAQGADGMYFNNFYQLGDVGVKDVHLLNPGKLAEGPRTYVMTYQDQVPIGETGYKPLPMDVGSGIELEIHMGAVQETENVKISIGYNLGSPNGAPWEITLNGMAPAEAKEMKINPYNTAGYYLTEDYQMGEAEILIQYTFRNVSTEDILKITIPASDATMVSLEVKVSPF